MADENEVQPNESETPAVEADAPARQEPGMERSALEAKVSQGLAGLREIDAPVETEEPAAEAEAEAEKPAAESPDPEPEPDEDGKEEGAEGESDDAEKQQPVVKKTTGPTLPASYIRTLKAYDWTDDEIAEAFRANPAAFTVTAQKMHANRNSEVARWADLGRASRQVAPAEETKETPGANRVDIRAGQIKPINVPALTEKYGNEELVREIAEPLNSVIEQLNAVLPDVLRAAESNQAAQVQALESQVNGFFGGEELKPYATLYGGDKDLSKENLDARNKVLELADALIAGAKLQGRTLKTVEALELAHDSVSSGHKTQAARQELKKSVTTRNKGITLKPSVKGAKDKSSIPANRGELEARTRSRLAQAFGS